MGDWPATQTHEWLMKTLYAQYVADEQASVRWSTQLESTGSHPGGEEIARETQQLADVGWVEIMTQAYGNLFVRMTPAGRETWEEFVEQKAANPAASLSLR